MNEKDRRTPAFLTADHRGLQLQTRQPTKRWTPPPNLRRMASAAQAVPRLTAEIGLGSTDVEILPGSPTTVIFTSGGKLKGMMVLPMDGDEARRMLGFPPITTTDLLADQLWEESRDVPDPETLLAELW